MTKKQIVLDYLKEVEEKALAIQDLQLYADTLSIENIIEKEM